MKKVKGFTLIELLFVLAIIAILSATVVSVYRNYVKNAAISALKADTRNCISFVASEIAEASLTGSTPDFSSGYTYISKYTQSCIIETIDANNEIYKCKCSGKGIINGIECNATTNSTELTCND